MKEEIQFVVVDQKQEQIIKSPGNQSPGMRNFVSIFVKNFIDTEDVWISIYLRGKKEEHTSNGFTMILFFDSESNTPTVDKFKSDISLDEKYFPHCIAAYWHYPSGEIKFSQYPLT